MINYDIELKTSFGEVLQEFIKQAINYKKIFETEFLTKHQYLEYLKNSQNSIV